jgi:hypothetical protein
MKIDVRLFTNTPKKSRAMSSFERSESEHRLSKRGLYFSKLWAHPICLRRTVQRRVDGRIVVRWGG